MIHWRIALGGALAASSAISCSALLGFPDETAVDPNFGLSADGQVQGDGNSQLDGNQNDGTSQLDASPDGSAIKDSLPPNDGPVVLPDGGCNCFGGACTTGACEPIAIVTGVLDPNYIDNDETTVFFATTGKTILALPINNIAGGTTTITSTEKAIQDLRARNGYVYFTNSQSSNYSVSRCGVPGCATTRTEYSTSSRMSYGVAVDDTNVYFSVNDGSGATGGIWSSPLTGGGATKHVARNYPQFLATNGTNVAWFEAAGSTGAHLMTTAGALIVTGQQAAIVDVAFGANPAAPTEVYLLKGGALWHQVGTQAPTERAGGAQVTSGFMVRVDALHVYWLNSGTPGSLVRCPVGVNCVTQPSEAKILAMGLANPGGLTLSNDSVYFTTRTDGKVWRVRK